MAHCLSLVCSNVGAVDTVINLRILILSNFTTFCELQAKMKLLVLPSMEKWT